MPDAGPTVESARRTSGIRASDPSHAASIVDMLSTRPHVAELVLQSWTPTGSARASSRGEQAATAAVGAAAESSQPAAANDVVGVLTKKGRAFPWSWRRRRFVYSAATRMLYYYDADLPEVDPSQLPMVALGQLVVRAVVPSMRYVEGGCGLLFVGDDGRLMHAVVGSADETAQWLRLGSPA